mmetsp:Transcript_64481/g.171942  ORF Transcript_64481/g.171942 Transcript_64481/m.171942 type:complete len:289 (+) Transcript_64481:157-1023(+)
MARKLAQELSPGAIVIHNRPNSASASYRGAHVYERDARFRHLTTVLVETSWDPRQQVEVHQVQAVDRNAELAAVDAHAGQSKLPDCSLLLEADAKLGWSDDTIPYLCDALARFPVPMGTSVWRLAFRVPWEMCWSAERGRGACLTTFVPEGTQLYALDLIANTSREAAVAWCTDPPGAPGGVVVSMTDDTFRSFLSTIDQARQCDLAMWSWCNASCAHSSMLDVAFTAVGLMNHGTGEDVTVDESGRAVRDLHPGDELREDYNILASSPPEWLARIKEEMGFAQDSYQ